MNALAETRTDVRRSISAIVEIVGADRRER
jgi:hypothetical protein